VSHKNIIVTGGAGYIGAHTCKALAAAGYQPIVYDNLCGGYKAFVKWGPLEIGDILDAQRLDSVFEKYNPHAVLHFAAHIGVGESVQNPKKYYQNNLIGSLSLLGAMGRHNISKIIFSSTAAVYGLPETQPINEEATLQPINPYGRTKLHVENAIKDFSEHQGFDWVNLRYFNAAGADPSSEIGEAHEPETHLIPLVLESIAGLRQSVDVFGTDYPTRDGTCIRDYIHVSDLAEAHVLALQSLERGAGSGVYNLGNGEGFSVREVIAAAERVTGKPAPVVFASRRPGDPALLVASSQKAKTILNWSPKYAAIDTIIDTAWRWLRVKQTALAENV
jgi:UDP-arabinose 4-epimerase